MKTGDFRDKALDPSPARDPRVMRKAPIGFGSLHLDSDQQAHLNKVAIETFMSLANRGIPFADCLGSVLLTGIEFAREVLAEKKGVARAPAMPHQC